MPGAPGAPADPPDAGDEQAVGDEPDGGPNPTFDGEPAAQQRTEGRFPWKAMLVALCLLGFLLLGVLQPWRRRRPPVGAVPYRIVVDRLPATCRVRPVTGGPPPPTICIVRATPVVSIHATQPRKERV